MIGDCSGISETLPTLGITRPGYTRLERDAHALVLLQTVVEADQPLTREDSHE